MAALPEILMTIGADTAGAEAGLARTAAAAEGSTGKMKGLFDAAEKAINSSMTEAVKHVTEAVGEIVKKFVDAGMGANAASESIAAGFDKLTGLHTEAIVEATNKVKDFVIQLKNLSNTVPLSQGKIVELKGAIEHFGLSSEHVPEILQTLTTNMAKAASGDQEAARKFHELGIATDGWQKKMPGLDTILVQLADRIKNSKNPLLEMNKAVEVGGDNLRDWMPFLQQGGAAVKAQAESHAANAMAIEHSTNAFQHLQTTESNLAEAMQNLLVPIFQALAQVIDAILQVVTQIVEWFTRFGRAGVEAGQMVSDAYEAMGKIIGDIFRPILDWLKQALDAFVVQLQKLGEWFQNMARIALTALAQVKDFIIAQLRPVFDKIGEGVDWVIQKFNSLKEWIGQVKNAIFEMAKPVIEAFQNIAKEIGDFFHMHWGDVAKDAREAAATLAADTRRVIAAAEGNTPTDPSLKFGDNGENGVAETKKSEDKKTDLVREGTQNRGAITRQGQQDQVHDAKAADDQESADWDEFMHELMQDTQAASKTVGNTLEKTPAPLIPAVQKAADKAKQIWQDMAHNMATAFSSAIRGMIDGTQTLGQAFAKIGKQMLSSLESVLEKMLEGWLQQHITELLIHTQTKEAEVGVDQAASAEKQEISMQEHIKEVFMAAKQAAVNAWKAFAGIPIVGPALGAAAATATFAAVMAFGSLTSAAGGFYEVDRDQLALIHKKEMVLPASIAERLRSNLASGADSSADLHVHVYSNVNAIDSASFKDTIKQHGNMIGNEVARILKKRNLATSS